MPEARRYSQQRRVRLSECAPEGRARLDAFACWLQDVASDDVADAGLTDDDGVWILRRAVIEVTSWPRLRDHVTVETWASGGGGTVAERRTSVGPGTVEATALWVALEPATMRPMRLTGRFWDVYGASIGDRRVTARLSHPAPPSDAFTRAWPLRYTDFDRVGHVNNAVYLEALEDVCQRGPVPTRVEVEYRGGLSPDDRVDLAIADGGLWFLQRGEVAASILYR